MMKLVALACLVALAAARPQKPSDIQIVRLDSDVGFDGTFQYAYETSDGTQAQQEGRLKQIGAEAGEAVSGSFSHKTPEGEQISLTYVADENGFQPQGAHLPTPPPVPEAILRALEYIRANPPKDINRRRR
ncbi:hypothetical protein R5R35_008917 [Gryllus longicercus]|uniref:Cuticular protein n=1 Tax=Gryllus longicercus TaxID=2509291 RepID=A0AAN9Z441_9ORTH